MGLHGPVRGITLLYTVHVTSSLSYVRSSGANAETSAFLGRMGYDLHVSFQGTCRLWSCRLWYSTIRHVVNNVREKSAASIVNVILLSWRRRQQIPPKHWNERNRRGREGFVKTKQRISCQKALEPLISTNFRFENLRMLSTAHTTQHRNV
jgi:hypothetical protein